MISTPLSRFNVLKPMLAMPRNSQDCFFPRERRSKRQEGQVGAMGGIGWQTRLGDQ